MWHMVTWLCLQLGIRNVHVLVPMMGKPLAKYEQSTDRKIWILASGAGLGYR